MSQHIIMCVKPGSVSLLDFDSFPHRLLVAAIVSLSCLVLSCFFSQPLASSLLIVWTVWCLLRLSAMADNSFVTLGTARSLLVDSSVCDSRLAETTKEHLFLGLACEDGQALCSLGLLEPSITSRNSLILC